jgi:hypothetical protein
MLGAVRPPVAHNAVRVAAAEKGAAAVEQHRDLGHQAAEAAHQVRVTAGANGRGVN